MEASGYSLANTGSELASISRFCAVLHRAWQVTVAGAICAGLFHLINLVDPGRFYAGPVLLTPFRTAFFLGWIFLAAEYVAARRRPRWDRFDLIIALIATLFLVRGLFFPHTLGTVVNWVVTGAGIFFLIKHGIRNKADVRLLFITVVAATLLLAVAGLVEYGLKSNQLFNSIQIDAIGVDQRVIASDQFYRIRSLVGHPGFAGSILVAATPLLMLALWRYRRAMALGLFLLASAIFLTFSRGSWMLAFFVLLPLLAFRARFWFRRNWKWLLPLTLLPLFLIGLDYWNREEVSISMGKDAQESGLSWRDSEDGHVMPANGEAGGAQLSGHFIYFDIDNQFYRGGHEPVTVVVRYLDNDYGHIRLEYDSWNEGGSDLNGAYTFTPDLNKTNTGEWTSVAFYLSDPRFDGRQNEGSDFRIVDEDGTLIVGQVALQKGKLKLPSLVMEQWFSRSSSFSTRYNLIPFTWSVLKENPWGAGLFNTPGTENHAIDSMPLTWLIEFGWLALPLLAGLLFLLLHEAARVWRKPQGALAVIFLALALMLLHGCHLMIVYDKPSLVMISVLAALYAAIRPGGSGDPLVKVSNEDCMI